MSWQVRYSPKALKGLKKLPSAVKDTVLVLANELEELGPVRGDWPNFSKLGKLGYHCHLKKGRPTYVACWMVDRTRKEIEVYYVGTHEKAPY